MGAAKGSQSRSPCSCRSLNCHPTAPSWAAVVSVAMNSNLNTSLNNAIQSLPPIVSIIISIIFLILAISWLVLPWTISGKLSAILRVQERQLAELERRNGKE
jgi:hypothetical protein